MPKCSSCGRVTGTRNTKCAGCLDGETILELEAKVTKLEAENKALTKDAGRYRFLRDEDNWGEDSGYTSWEMLGESHAEIFDKIVDARIAMRG